MHYSSLFQYFLLELKHRRACVWKIQYEGVYREANTARGEAEYCSCLETPPEYCFLYTQARRCFKCYIVLPGRVWLRAIFSSTQTAAIFSDKDTSKCLTNLFLVVQRTNRISLASFSDLQCHARDQSCCLSESCLKAS